jgi:peptidoglycan/LPS O-acetylase OafA/YrhL
MAEKRPTHIRALAGMRAVPPLVLVAFHFCEGHGYRHFTPFDLLAAKGYLWVEFFFALSGFVLTYVYSARIKDLWKAKGYFTFLRARLARLYPLHLFMMLTVLVLTFGLSWAANVMGYGPEYARVYKSIVTLPSFFANLALVHAWNLFPWLTWNGVSWFVSVEFLLCLLFPLYLWLANGKIWRGFVLITAGLLGLWWLLATSNHGLDITFHNGIFRGMADFAVGVGLAVIIRESKIRFSDRQASILQIGVLVALLWGIYRTGWSHTARDIWTVLPMFALIFVLSFDRGVVARALHWHPFQAMGEWSFAVYIGQGAWLQLIRFFETVFYPADDTLVAGMRWGDFIWWAEPVGLMLVCAGWGWLLMTAIEKPAARLLAPRPRKLDPEGAGLPSKA